MFLFVIQLLIFPVELKFNIICSPNESILVTDSHFRLKEGNQFELIEQFHPFTFIDLMDYELQDYNLTFVTRTLNLDRFLFVFQNKNFIHIRVCILQLSIQQDIIKNQNFITENELTIQPIGKLLNTYLSSQNLYLIYEEFQDSNEYLIQIMNPTNMIVLNSIRIKKQKDCIYNFEENLFGYFYFAQFNCSHWIVQIFSIHYFELQKEIKFDDFKQILRQTNFLQATESLQLLFDNYVQYYKPSQQQFDVIFEYQDGNILCYDSQFYILNITQNDSAEINGIIREERPKRTLHVNKDLVLLFDSHIELLKTTDLSFVSAIQLDEIFIFQSSYPYFYGVRNNKIILIRANQLNPIFKCAENTSFWAAFYRDQNLRYLDWIFTQRKIEITYEQILYFNIDENIYQSEIPIIIKEYQQDFLELEISLNKFILGGPFDILDVKSDQNTIVTYESTQSQFCKFLDFSKIQWWIFLYNSKDEQVLLVQDDNLILHLVNCDLQIKKNLFKIGRISLKQISLRNSLLLMQNNKYSLFLFEIQNNLKYRIDQIQFKKEIKYIQPMYSFFHVYLDDWEIYRIYSFSQGNSFDIEKLPSISKVLLKSQIIFCKVISNNDFMIGTESEILQQQKNFIHLIQVQDIQDIIKVKQNLYEFVIIHKSKSQDSIKVKLKKYFLNNFQMISMFELPKPNQSFEYIWPICINENGQYLTIAAKDSKTNNTFVLIYEISQPYSTILKDIIQVDCCDCLQLLRSGVIVYQFQNQLFQQNIDIIKLKVKFDNNNQTQMISNDILFTLRSKINQQVKKGLKIQLISFAQTRGLQHKNNGKLMIDNHQPFVFDPRKYIIGSLQNITSQSITITQALKPIDQIIMSGKSIDTISFSQFIYNNIKQQIDDKTFDILEQWIQTEYSNKTEVLQVENDQHIFIIKTIQNLKDIKVFDSNYHFKYQLIIENYQCHKIYSIIKIDNFQFIICPNAILLYVINNNQTQFLSSITNSLIECTIEKINNKKWFYLAYDKKSLQQNCILIEILESNQISTTIFIIDIENQFNVISEQFNSILLKNLQIYEDNYLSITGFYFMLKKNAQLFQLTIDIQSNQTISIIQNGIINYPRNTIIQKFLYLNQFLVILFSKNYQSLQSGLTLVFYDLHEKEQFKIFDYISLLENQIYDIVYHNDSFFYLFGFNEENFIISLYQTSQYLFEFPRQQAKEYEITLFNQIDSIEMIITIQNPIDQQLYLTVGLLFSNLVCILLLLGKKRNKKLHENIIAITQK